MKGGRCERQQKLRVQVVYLYSGATWRPERSLLKSSIGSRHNVDIRMRTIDLFYKYWLYIFCFATSVVCHSIDVSPVPRSFSWFVVWGETVSGMRCP